MSLPLASKEISSHPGKNAVTSPTDRDAMQADVDRKMRLYGVIEAFRQNKYPDNHQIDETLRYVLNNSPVDESKLSREGRKLIQDVRDVIETSRQIIKQKNGDELLQEFLFHTVATDAPKPKVDTDVVPVGKEDLNRDGTQAVQHLRTLLTLIATNSEARKLLSDVSLIGRDLFARSASHVADKARPHPDQLARVDDAAPSDQWENPDGRITGTNETPVLQAGRVIHDPKASGSAADATVVRNDDGTERSAREVGHSAREQASQVAREGHDQATGGAPPPQTAGEAYDQYQGAKANTRNTAASVAKDEARQIRDEVENSPEDNGEATKRSLKERMFGVKDKIPQEHRDRAKDEYNRGVDFLKDEFPEERRDQYIYRLKKVIVECQKHQDYQEALTWFIGAIENYTRHARTLGDHHANKAGDVAEDPALKRASSELRTLLERFANGTSLDGIFNAVDQLATDARNDEELRNWFKELDAYVRKTLLEPGYILAPDCNNQANRLQESGRRFFDEKYAGHKDALFDNIQAWFRAWADDPLNRRFATDWKRLTKDLLFSEDGNLTFKPHLWTDIRKVIMPALIEQVGYIPIPRIEYTDNQMDLVIENLTLQGANILPNIVSVEAHNFFEFSPYDAIPDRGDHGFKFTFHQIQADMRDVAFYFNKKTGLPKLKDSGLADVFLGGQGLTVTVHLTDAGKDHSSVFKVKDVNVKVDSLKFSVRDTKHDLLYKTLKPLATGLVKKQIAKAIQDSITTGLEFLDEQLVGVRDRMAEARSQDDQSTLQALSQIFERKADEASSVASKAESKAAKKDAQFKIVTKRESVLIPEGYEGGWINKQAEHEKLAKTSDGGWRSPSFNIIPGANSTRAPSTATGTTGTTAH